MREINTVYVDLPTKIRGFIHENNDGGYTIVINSRLCAEMQHEVYWHELRHLYNDDFRKKDIDAIEGGLL